MEKNLRIFETHQQTFQKTEILSFSISKKKKKKLTNVKNEHEELKLNLEI